MTPRAPQLFSARLAFALCAVAATVGACRCGDAGVDELDGGGAAWADGGAGRDGGALRDGGGAADAGSSSGGDAGAQDGGVEPAADAGALGAPALLDVLPPRGPTAGSSSATLRGRGFLRGVAATGSEARRLTALRLGGNPVIDFTIVDDGTIELQLPPGAPGPAALVLENPRGRASCGDCFTFFEPLALTGLSPHEGGLTGGERVVLEGEGLTSEALVLFGGRPSPWRELTSSGRLVVVAPPATATDAGAVDVEAVASTGTARLRRAYTYREAPQLLGVEPPAAARADSQTVRLRGARLGSVTAVALGGEPLPFTVESDELIAVSVPPLDVAGALPVRLSTSWGEWTWRDAYAALDARGVPTLHGVFPHVAREGDSVLLTGEGLERVEAVWIGGAAAAFAREGDFALRLTVPARGTSPRRSPVSVALDGGVELLSKPGAFTWRVAPRAVSPTSGASDGGLEVTLTGEALPEGARVFVGPLEAAAVQVESDERLAFVTPPALGGGTLPVRVVDPADAENHAALDAAFRVDEALELLSVDPGRGAVAGGTLLTLRGRGFGEGVLVELGAARAKDLRVLDAQTIVCRAPRASTPGIVDVRVARGGASATLRGAYAYVDPRSSAGGLSGGPLVGSLNVTVLDSSAGLSGMPVPQAEVLVGLDSDTPLQGVTDLAGQLTLSEPNLVGPLTVTVSKAEYQRVTVAGVTAENVTVYLSRPVRVVLPPSPPSGGGGGSGGSVGVVSGRVAGFKSPRRLGSDEHLEARVLVAGSALFTGPPFGGLPFTDGQTWELREDGAEYAVYAWPGLRAVYAVLGIVDERSGAFAPVSMGVRRGITVLSGEPASGNDVVLDMPLDVAVPVTLDAPLTFQTPAGASPGQNALYAWLELGAEGFVPHPLNWAAGKSRSSAVTGTGATMAFPAFPQLDGAHVVFLVATRSPAGGAESYTSWRQPGVLSQGVTIGPLLPVPRFVLPVERFAGEVAWAFDGAARPDVQHLEIRRTDAASIGLDGPLVWEIVLPGDAEAITLPPELVRALAAESGAGSQLFFVLRGGRSPRFAYHQWTYESLGGTWTSRTAVISSGVLP